MARPRLPAAKAKAAGADLKNPGRFKDRKAPKNTRPLGKPYAQAEEISLFDEPKSEEKKPAPVAVPCRVKDWRRQKSVCFRTLKEPLIK